MRNRFRIIGGEWRGRKLAFPDVHAVRPSPDRVRETAFNWLAPVIEGARCLDLFAGSGALGLEALSRGAHSVVFVDSEREALDRIESHLETLKCDRGNTVLADAFAYLQGTPARFDVVFLDPPFRTGMVAPVVVALAQYGWAGPGARVYIECEAEAGAPDMPPGWTLHRSGKAGQVGYHLALTGESRGVGN